jgi:hypothetical protein
MGEEWEERKVRGADGGVEADINSQREYITFLVIVKQEYSVGKTRNLTSKRRETALFFTSSSPQLCPINKREY